MKNSALLRDLLRYAMSSSMASTGESGLSTRRSTKMRCRSSFGISSSSLRVPERWMSRAGKTACHKLPIENHLHVASALELFEDDFIHARAGIDERRGDDGQRAAFFDVPRRAEERFGRCSAFESTPPESTLPEDGTMVL